MTTDELAWDRVLRLHGRIEHELGKALQRRHGLGLSEFRALGKLTATQDGVLRMQDLAEAIGLNQSSVSRMVVRLEDAGLTDRDPCEDDRRGVYTCITETGRKRYAETESTYREVLATALDKAHADPELKNVVAALRGS
ncbi:MarR family winged helix-turn-helix transcriptional regulator [Amycolatopsis regifaucium]|uniref:MarR family transcriptional regulator n=1 Tax=Amycolatopsis regifaucium TaxID=546365 RepID=A0A154MDG3_9PSEU|nr:MarR family transcriptional regulator [Amycolatopsis regifaucium]KZB82270.1 MarR family transcriptional regulator [Amycolatopsis regifaucium]OKA05658.1 MarR family transcriptional regulator [Amycolatopsis regifaucium]SFG88169.1 DNA-binding transcriptional regulator, MarR family [Amycolatopsis regifaucium]